jgi:hypothetical protein
MNADVFEDIGYYFEQSLNLIVYAYEKIRKDKIRHPYSRCVIHETTQQVRQSSKSHNEIEDFLRNDMVNNYLKKYRHLFLLEGFCIQAGTEESKQNVKTGIVDIKFEYTSATSMDGTAFTFECKRLNQYAASQNAYIKDGMIRFVSGQYYPESRMAIAGMIAFVEVDIEKHQDGYLPVEQVADRLGQKINANKNILKTKQPLSPFRLNHKKYTGIPNFKHSYLSSHLRSEDNLEISIHHLLLDYYKILVS